MADVDDIGTVFKNLYNLVVYLFAFVGVGTTIYWIIEASKHLVITWK